MNWALRIKEAIERMRRPGITTQSKLLWQLLDRRDLALSKMTGGQNQAKPKPTTQTAATKSEPPQKSKHRTP